MTNTARLVDDAGGTILTLGDESLGTTLRTLDLGFPTVREQMTPLSGQDGELDNTQLLGSRGITAEVAFQDTATAGAALDTLRGLMHPGRRYWLRVLMDGWSAERMVRVRGASFAAPTAALPWTGQLGWKAASPMWLDSALSQVTLNPSAQPGGGMSFPMSFPMSFQPGYVPGASILQVGGTVPALPVIDMYGPFSGALFRVVDTGLQLSFPTFTLAAGDYLHVDMQAKTITLNNDLSQSRLNRLDFSNSSGWPGLALPPGSPQVVFSPQSSSGGCQAVLSWRNSWL